MRETKISLVSASAARAERRRIAPGFRLQAYGARARGKRQEREVEPHSIPLDLGIDAARRGVRQARLRARVNRRTRMLDDLKRGRVTARPEQQDRSQHEQPGQQAMRPRATANDLASGRLQARAQAWHATNRACGSGHVKFCPSVGQSRAGSISEPRF